MKKLEFEVDIDAPKEKVWDTLWGGPTYEKWTNAFNKGSKAVTDWKEGSKVLFISDKGGGMYSKIAKSVPNTMMSIEHLGVLKNGQEQPLHKESVKWSGAMENYMLEEYQGKTRLKVNMDTTEEFSAYFKEKFPQALESVKMLAEGKESTVAEHKEAHIKDYP